MPANGTFRKPFTSMFGIFYVFNFQISEYDAIWCQHFAIAIWLCRPLRHQGQLLQMTRFNASIFAPMTPLLHFYVKFHFLFLHISSMHVMLVPVNLSTYPIDIEIKTHSICGIVQMDLQENRFKLFARVPGLIIALYAFFLSRIM